MYKVALVGLGGISNTHLPVWKELDDCELVAVCDTRPEQMAYKVRSGSHEEGNPCSVREAGFHGGWRCGAAVPDCGGKPCKVYGGAVHPVLAGVCNAEGDL